MLLAPLPAPQPLQLITVLERKQGEHLPTEINSITLLFIKPHKFVRMAVLMKAMKNDTYKLTPSFYKGDWGAFIMD